MQPVVVINGATASGKSTAAVELACRLGERGQPAEIVNCDSMVVYRGMDIGTAKPTEHERRGVPHHLVDVLDVRETASVAEFQSSARAMVAQCRRRGVVPVLVGGSALYVRAAVDHFEFPPRDEDLRRELEAELERLGAEALHERLRAVAPEAADRIEPGNGRRIVRALEVVTLTGEFTAELPDPRYALNGVMQWGISWPRELLDERIAHRVETMWSAGLVDEVRRLVAQGLRDGRTASRALGYRQVLEFLDGQCSEDQAKAATVVATRRFARRQLAWFRRDPRIEWFDHDKSDIVGEWVQRVGDARDDIAGCHAEK